MNCEEVRNLAPLYLSGEMVEAERQRFAAHLAVCADCERELEAHVLVDTRLAAALLREAPDTSRIERHVREQIAAEQVEPRRRWMAPAAIAATVILVAGGYWMFRPAPAPPWYADAARDHHAEVVEGQQRRWRTNTTDLDALAGQYGLSVDRLATLAPAGFTLVRAKNCGLGGQRMLHLVFGDAGRKISVYLRATTGAPQRIRAVHYDSGEVAGFETGHYQGAVVSAGDAAECEKMARQAAEHL